LVLNNILLVTAAATVFVGTLYPLALEGLTGAKISVGAPYYNMTFVPLMVPLLFTLPMGPLLAWKRGDLAGVRQRLFVAALISAAAALLTFALAHDHFSMAPFGIALGVWVMAGAATEWLQRIKFGSAGMDEVVRRARNLPRSAYGTAFGHFGIGLMVVGIVATTAYREEHILVMKPGQSVEAAGYTVTFKGAAPARGPNYREDVADFAVMRNGAAVTDLQPSKRIYDMPPQPTTEAGIHNSWRGDLYIVIGDEQLEGGAYAVRVFFNPLVRFIWIGALIMFIGGGLSLTDRRLHVGVPVKARKQKAAVA